MERHKYSFLTLCQSAPWTLCDNKDVVLIRLGANFNDLSLAELESLETSAPRIRDELFKNGGSGVVIGTCNRFEIYLETEQTQKSVDHAINVTSQTSGLDIDYLSEVLSVSLGSSVAQHLYSVASGLDSMVIGEGEIAGQVRDALKDAQENGHASTTVNGLFQSASAVAKRIANETGLGAAGRSIIAAGLDFYQGRHGSLSGKKVVLFGTGAYARVSVAALQRLGVSEIRVASESGRAAEFSENRGTIPIERGELRSALANADLVVAASGSRNFSLSYHLAKDVLALQSQEGLRVGIRVVDVALAKSVAPSAYELDGVEVIDLDYIHHHVPREQTEAVARAKEIVLEAVEEFEAEQAARAVDPMIARLREHVSGWVADEVKRVRKRSGNETAAEVERSLNRVTNAILHTPSVNAKELAKAGNPEDYAAAVKTVFGIDLNGEVQ
ncbi:MAG: hypothetical protein RJA35_1385 [Actinomycetota bacterium]